MKTRGTREFTQCGISVPSPVFSGTLLSPNLALPHKLPERTYKIQQPNVLQLPEGGCNEFWHC